MIKNKEYTIPETPEERVVKALESIAKSLQSIEKIVSDPSDEVEHDAPTDIKDMD